MARKQPTSAVFTVRTPEALTALSTWMGTVGETTRRKGEDYFRQLRVLGVWAGADHFVDAEVEGQEIYDVTLFLTRGKWTSKCSCPVGVDCKHAVAAALTWIDSGGADVGEDLVEFVPMDPATPPLNSAFAGFSALRAPATKIAVSKTEFRKRWAPEIAEKLGRKLTPEENRQLEQLATLYGEFTQSHWKLFSDALERHGFTALVPPGANRWSPLFPGWWHPESPPADPWALWQFLAYSAESRGQPIPEIFRPLTDTARVHTALDAIVSQQQINAWRMAMSDGSAAGSVLRVNPITEGVSQLRGRLDPQGRLVIETRSDSEKPWKPATQKWYATLINAVPADFEALPPAEAALALTLALTNRHGFRGSPRYGVQLEVAEAVFACRAAHPALVLPDGRPFAIEADPLVPEAVMSAQHAGRLDVSLVAPDGTTVAGVEPFVLRPSPLYYHAGRVWRGPPPLPAVPLPAAALADSQLMSNLRARGVRLPSSLEAKVRRVALRPRLKCWLKDPGRFSDVASTEFCAQLFAYADEPHCVQEWRGQGGWQWALAGAPPARRPDEPILEFDLTAANAVGSHFTTFRLTWAEYEGAWVRFAPKNFPEEFLAWHASLPPGLEIDASPELATFFGPPLRASMDFSARPTDAEHDWFDLTIALRVEDTTLTAAEIALLLKARGKWVRLPKGGWRRLELAGAELGTAAAATLDRLGLTAGDVLESGRAVTHRLHALQLAGEADALAARDAKLAAHLRERVATLANQPPPPLPAGLTATLRPYQIEGFHFLAHLSAQGFGGVLADDMGLGKTVQTLAWLLHLVVTADQGGRKFRALVVCPKSVTHGWLAETARFAPSLTITAFDPALAGKKLSALNTRVLVANYTQLRLNAEWFHSETWDAVVLDEGQFIKNPSSQIAVAARALPARHRIVLTGTPVENRLTDLWSLFAFAQPGLLGPQTSFRRQYDEKDPAALTRLHRRVRHFLLRRTKAQAAPDLPPRTEDDLIVELEPAQRQLYDAELKRARAQLLGIATARELDQVRFNILASLLRLRQICCHPALVDPAHAKLPSAKLDALLERLEELAEEGHQVLVFSQFVTMLEIIRERLVAAGLGHLVLTGQTENRAELVEEFQRDRTKTVFLLSLKAAGFGLNLTAASYAILYDPWWNPAVEAQAIDRTHRIGQTRPVIAYRLLAENTVEQKIRALQQEKAALAAAVVQEESLASVLDLESLRQILA